ESPLKDHPLNPMSDSNLVRVLARQSNGKVGLLNLDVVSRGPDAVAARLGELKASGIASCVADAVSEGDLETLGEVAFANPVSTGASGLGLGLARGARQSGKLSAAENARRENVKMGGLAAAVAGSCSHATLEQIARAEQIMPVRRLDTARLLSDDAAGEV